MSGIFYSTQTLPSNYQSSWCLDMRERKNLIFANLIALLVLIIVTPLVFLFTSSVRTDQTYSLPLTGLSGLADIIVLVLALALMLLVHEGIHGICIWIFTGSAPKFALKVYYAYAAAPGWYFSKWPYFFTAIAPLIVISALGLLAIALVPIKWVFTLMLVVIFNASGAVGDAWVAAALLTRNRSLLAQDDGDKVTFFEAA